MANNVSILSGESWTKRDADFMELDVRCRISIGKSGNNGLRGIEDGFTYMPNLVCWNVFYADIDTYKKELLAIATGYHKLISAVVIENEYTGDMATLVQMYKAAVDVFSPYGIAVLTSGTFPQYASGEYANALSGSERRAWIRRNPVTQKRNVIAAFNQEIDLIKKAGLRDKLYYNMHYQFADNTYLPDYTTLVNFMRDKTGMKQANNEFAINRNGSGMGKVLAQGCLLHDYSGIYNTVGAGGRAVRMNADTQSEFIATLRF